MNYTLSSNTKKFLFGLIGVGVLMLLLGAMQFEAPPAKDGEHGIGFIHELWTNLLANGVFFFGISLLAVFFIAVQYAAEAAWATVFKRIYEGVSKFLPIGAVIVLLLFIWGAGTGIYHWAHYNHLDLAPDHPDFDHLLEKKSAFLNFPLTVGMLVLFFGVYYLFHQGFLKRTNQEDEEGGVELHKKNIKASAGFLVFFGFTSVVFIWIVLMSIDAHWFSTMYSWYVFSGMWISFITITILIVNHFRSKGLMPWITSAHMHDMGKWMFAISFLWTYLFFCQFMLIWYANIPEEVMYYTARMEDYNFVFFGMMLINFVLPMLLLMDKDAKVNSKITTVVGIIIFFGHYVDTWMLITPGVMQRSGEFGLFDLGMFLMFLGGFMYFTLSQLAKKPLIVKNHPFLEESKNLGH